MANAQRGVMQLGGNLPESLIKYTMLGSAAEFEETVKEMSPNLQREEPIPKIAADSDSARNLAAATPINPDVAAKLPPVELPWDPVYLTGSALRKQIARQKLTKMARRRLEAAEAAKKKKKNRK